MSARRIQGGSAAAGPLHPNTAAVRESFGRPLTDEEAERLAEVLYHGLRALGWFDRRPERPVLEQESITQRSQRSQRSEL